MWKLGEHYAAGPQSHSYAPKQEFGKAGFVWSFIFFSRTPSILCLLGKLKFPV